MKFLRPILTFIIVLFLTGPAFSQSSAELKRRKKALTKEIELLNRSLKKTSSNKQLSLKQINVLNTQIRLREEKISTINSEIRLLDDQISDNTSTVKNLQAQLSDLKKEYAAMILFAFKNRSAYNKLMFIFSAKDFNQAYKRLKYLNQFSKYRKKQAGYIEQTQHGLHVKIVELDQNKKEKSSLLEDEQEEKQTLGKEKNHQSQVLNKLSSQEKKLQKQLVTKKKESARLNRAIRSAIEKEIEAARRKAAAQAAARAAAAKAQAAKMAAANKSSSSTTAKSSVKEAKGSSVLSATPESAKLSSNFLSNRGSLPWPVASGSIVEGFGNHSYGVNVTLENNGVDIKTAPGATVRAVFSGEVSTVANIGGNFVVLIRHGEYFTVYSNLRSASVSRGQKVSTKQAIGTVVTDPSDNTTQLHFEVRKGATPLNPSGWLAR
ncbi:murein hydrolase activator EnvC family protein [Rubrolithibacter danxiaensis]|uniref:murein hydrolase activator EnvC family protein n=1 Tax=Rubrolithibacter danxiaensis TaxID=3390805 RepID=UPI003BF90878